MLYKKIDVELIVALDEAEAVVAALHPSLDQLDEKYTLFGGEIETATFEHRGTRKRSALTHTIAAGESVATALRTARESLLAALHAVARLSDSERCRGSKEGRRRYSCSKWPCAISAVDL
jgi:hypothetical protein